jgi:putative transposase
VHRRLIEQSAQAPVLALHETLHSSPDLRKRYWGRRFWAWGYFSTTSGNITDDVILQYLQKHEPTGASR